MKVLIACESSGRVRDAFLRKGHQAMSCDLLPTEMPGPHYQGDVRDVISEKWDLLIAHPECTYLANSGVHWLHKDVGRWPKLFEAAEFFMFFLNAKHIPKKVIENPIQHKYARAIIKKQYSQIIHPWQFGHEEMKSTCLWLDGVSPLRPTNIVGPPPKDAPLRKKWAVVHRMPPGPDRWKERSRTYQGIADAMGSQWG